MNHTPPPYSDQTVEVRSSILPSTVIATRRLSRSYSPGPPSPLRSPPDTTRGVPLPSVPDDENRSDRRPSSSSSSENRPDRRPSSSSSSESRPDRRPSSSSSSSAGDARSIRSRVSLSGPSSPVRIANLAQPPSSSLGPSPPSPSPVHRPLASSRPVPSKRPIRGLSLNIPPGSLAYGGLTPSSAYNGSTSGSTALMHDKVVAPLASALEGPASMVEAVLQQQQQQQGLAGVSNNAVKNVHVQLTPPFSQRKALALTSPGQSASSVKKRPARLNLAPPPLLPGFVADQGNLIEREIDDESDNGPEARENVVSQGYTMPSLPLGDGRNRLCVPSSSAATLPRRRQTVNADLEGSTRGDISPAPASRTGVELSPIQTSEKQYLRNTLTGRPRRRPSMPFPNLRSDRATSAVQLSQPVIKKSLPESWQDPSEHPLSGEGSSLQHARSVYAAGPIEVLPGLFLGDEYNARDDELLADYNITTILDVAKETISPLQAVSQAKGSGSMILGPHRWSSTVPAQVTQRARPSFARSFTMDEPSLEEDDFHVAISIRGGASGSQDQTPSAASFPEDALLTPLQRSPSRRAHHLLPQLGIVEDEHEHEHDQAPALPTHLLRHALSTPLLQSDFALDRRGDQREPPSDPTDEDLDTQASEQGAYSISSKASSTTTDATSPGSSSEPGEKQLEVPQIQVKEDGRSPVERLMPPAVGLPMDAIVSTIPASPLSGRPQAVNYVKLPWTHEQTELAAPGGGFVQGCAIVAQALGIDYFGRPLIDPVTGQKVKGGNILVHCQCGVSRSATLTIAFVMQSAALNYPFEQTRNLTGMHDCYNLVKDLSSSISPNISLIYQLVEWERHLSNEAARLREALNASTEEQLAESGLLHGTATDSLRVSRESDNPSFSSSHVAAAAASTDESVNGSRVSATRSALSLGWSNDTMGEEEWTRMRREEERKEAMEQADRRRAMEEERERQAEERRDNDSVAANATEVGSGSVAVSPDREGSSNGGLCARRRKHAPSLQLGPAVDRRQLRSGNIPALTLTTSSSSGGSGGVGSTSSLSSDIDSPLRSARLGGSFPTGRIACDEQSTVPPAGPVKPSHGVSSTLLTRSLDGMTIAEKDKPRAADDDAVNEPLRTASVSSRPPGDFDVKGAPTLLPVESGITSETIAASLPHYDLGISTSLQDTRGGAMESTSSVSPSSRLAPAAAFLSLRRPEAAGKVGTRRAVSYHLTSTDVATGSATGSDNNPLGSSAVAQQQTRPPFPGSWSLRQSLSQGSILPSQPQSGASSSSSSGVSAVGMPASVSAGQQQQQQLQQQQGPLPPLSFRPKMNFGMIKGVSSSAERKLQHRRTFSSEVKWEILTAKGGGGAGEGEGTTSAIVTHSAHDDAAAAAAAPADGDGDDRGGEGEGVANASSDITDDPNTTTSIWISKSKWKKDPSSSDFNSTPTPTTWTGQRVTSSLRQVSQGSPPTSSSRGGA